MHRALGGPHGTTRIHHAYRRRGSNTIQSARAAVGERPATLPVQQVTKVELFINQVTAKALGITVPVLLLGRADEVIE